MTASFMEKRFGSVLIDTKRYLRQVLNIDRNCARILQEERPFFHERALRRVCGARTKLCEAISWLF